MTKLLKTLVIVAVIGALSVGVAYAGLNSASTARLYWMAGTAATSTASTLRNSVVNTTVYGQVTVRNLSSMRGEDIQIILNALDGSGLPPAWQSTGLGGPADGNWGAKYYTWASTTFPDIFLTALDGGAVPGIAKSQDGSNLFYNYTSSPCLTPHLVGLLWVSIAGGTGKSRSTAREFGAFGFKMILNTGCCTGDGVDPAGPIGVCLAANWRQPCTDAYGRKMQLLDANNHTDIIPYDSGYEWLTWHGELVPGSPPVPCWQVTPAKNTTWGQIKRLYH